MRSTLQALGTLGSIVVLIANCGGEMQTPEDQVRAQIQKATIAAEKKDLGTLRDLISEHYADNHQQDKRGVEATLRFHFFRNQTIHLLTRVPELTVTDADHALATVLVAMAGVPIASANDLPSLRADLHHFDLEFIREDSVWRVQRAAWQRAEPAEFITP